MRSENFTSKEVIKKHYDTFDENAKRGGPVILTDKGRNFYDVSEKHVAAIGRTGTGKSQVVSLPAILTALKSNESVIAIDPKGELYKKTACFAKNHNCICIDFRNLFDSPNGWNPLYAIAAMILSGDIKQVDIGYSMLHELASGINPPDKDPFWSNSSIELFQGAVLALIEKSSCYDEINMVSVCDMIETFPKRFGCSIYANELAENLPVNSIARRHLQSYIGAPNETRGSIHSVTSNSLRIFSQSEGLKKMLCQDTVHINELDIDEKPLAFYIIIPDEDNTYDALAGVLLSQVTQHFIRLAENKYDGKLPHTLHVFIEEIGSIGNSISNLPNLMTAARSRNIRMYLFLQSMSQLDDIYGKSKAETITSCIGITYAFATNNWDTLLRWQQICGNKSTEFGAEPLITATQLYSMPNLMALVLIDQYKYVNSFPLFHNAFDLSEWMPPQKGSSVNPNFEPKVFNLEKYIKEAKKQEYIAMMKEGSENKVSSKEENLTLKQLAEKCSEEMKNMPKPYQVIVFDYDEKNRDKVIDIIQRFMKMDYNSAKDSIKRKPYLMRFLHCNEARRCYLLLKSCGCNVAFKDERE